MYEERTKANYATFNFSSKAALLFEIIRASMEVQEYRSIVRNDGNDKSFSGLKQYDISLFRLFFPLHLHE